MSQSFLSTKPIPQNERLIMALDLPSIEKPENWLKRWMSR